MALEGNVPFWSQRADAEVAVTHLVGVRRVLNHVVVSPTESLDGEKLRDAVRL